MKKLFEKEILKLNKLPYVNKKTIEKFLGRLSQDSRLTSEENPRDHFCSFFVPVYFPTSEIFVGHHIKADEWIPPGGHIEKKEMPQDTVLREFVEELQHKISRRRIKLFDIGITIITNNLRNRKCRMHRDLWHYTIMSNKENFVFDKGEFYEAEWLPIDIAIKRAYRKEITAHLINLKKIIKHQL